MRKVWDYLSRLTRTRSGLMIIITAAVLLEAMSLAQYYYVRRTLGEAIDQRALAELRYKCHGIRIVMSSIEVALKNHVWDVKRLLAWPDSMNAAVGRIVEQNPEVVCSSISFAPDYYPQKGRLFEAYALRLSDGTIVNAPGQTTDYDYTRREYYAFTAERDSAHWSEPYESFNEGRTITTFSIPIHDDRGRLVATLDADVSLDWLGDIISQQHIFPSSYNLIVSRTGHLIANPSDKDSASISEVMKIMSDTATVVNRKTHERQLLKKGTFTCDGMKYYVFHALLTRRTGWRMSVVCPENEVYGDLRRMHYAMLPLMALALLFLGYIVHRTARNDKRLHRATMDKEHMENELRIARNIQMEMLPAEVASYPERDDISVYASLVPAKEVGGDFYNFFIRDEKLFFCIGDVSGKGIPSALVMAVTKSLFRTAASHEAHPATIMQTINEIASERNESSMFVTMFVGVLDLPTGRLRYCNAGHNAPVLVSNTVSPLPVVANLPVGIMGNYRYKGQELQLPEESILFLYTDGLTEAKNPGRQMYGPERLLQCLQPFTLPEHGNKADRIIKTVSMGVHRFLDGADPGDDLTMLVVDFKKSQQERLLHRTLTLNNDVKEVTRLNRFVKDICHELNLDAKTTKQLTLAIEEAMVNAMTYAYPADTRGSITLEAESDGKHLKFILTDSGNPFDPTSVREADTSSSLDDRPIGGLGIFLVRQLMDSINYERTNGKNILTIQKKLTIKQ